MDYNSRPWTYEVVTINGAERNVCITTLDEGAANHMYNKMFVHYPCVLLSKSRKGHALGQYEV
jgi:hypothetical protein